MSIGPIEGSQSQEVDLNLAPILDAFVVLIAFMLASASFLSIGILDAGVAAPSSAPLDTTPPPVNISITIKGQDRFYIEVTGKAKQNITIAATANGLNYGELKSHLTQIKNQWPTVDALTLSADNRIEYRKVVKAMDEARKVIPVVLLGGF
jgi:biopolymer transport protein ExbD